MQLFYTPEINSDTYTLSEEESKHCIKVLRLRMGDPIVLIDGRGGWYEAKIKDDNFKKCVVEIVEIKKEYGKRKLHVHIAIAPTKNMNRFEWFTEKATEMGIEEITPIECQNIKRTVVKTDRLTRVAISAIKQSYKSYLPLINEMTEFKALMSSSEKFTGQKFIAHCYPSLNEKGQDNKVHIKNAYEKGGNVLILIGPEGDFTQEEVKLALNNGFEEISLGEGRLRTETAGLYACMAINFLNS